MNVYIMICLSYTCKYVHVICVYKHNIYTIHLFIYNNILYSDDEVRSEQGAGVETSLVYTCIYII